MKNREKVVLVVLDGYGIGEENKHTNAIYAANTPTIDFLMKKYSYAKLHASEEAVGIRKNQFGNSELGHMTIGSGRTIFGIGEKAHHLIKENKFINHIDQLPWIHKIIDDKTVHIFGLYSSGCVHSDKENIDEMIKFFQDKNVNVFLHLFSDGRDTSKFCFKNDLKNLISWIKPNVKIASISGRYYAMDRDKDFNLINKAYDAIMQTRLTNLNPIEYVDFQYDKGNDDEFIEPISFLGNVNISETDNLLFMNFRSDRIRQIIHKFNLTEIFDPNQNVINNKNIFSICSYPYISSSGIIFEKQIITNTLNELLIQNQIKQLRIAETEKYAHVTFFFDTKKDAHNLKTEIMIPSPDVATYDLQPEMSANQITNYILDNVEQYDFILINYANSDMVGHTGNFEATVKAIECLDKQIKLLYNKIVLECNGHLIITADHGNSDCMKKDNEIVKTHTISDVPFIIASNKYNLVKHEGSLQDVAPTILFVYNIDIPTDMTGHNLIEEKHD